MRALRHARTISCTCSRARRQRHRDRAAPAGANCRSRRRGTRPDRSNSRRRRAAHAGARAEQRRSALIAHHRSSSVNAERIQSQATPSRRGRDRDHVETAGRVRVLAMRAQPGLRGARHLASLGRVHRDGGAAEARVAAEAHFDEDQRSRLRASPGRSRRRDSARCAPATTGRGRAQVRERRVFGGVAGFAPVSGRVERHPAPCARSGAGPAAAAAEHRPGRRALDRAGDVDAAVRRSRRGSSSAGSLYRRSNQAHEAPGVGAEGEQALDAPRALGSDFASASAFGKPAALAEQPGQFGIFDAVEFDVGARVGAAERSARSRCAAAPASADDLELRGDRARLAGVEREEHRLRRRRARTEAQPAARSGPAISPTTALPPTTSPPRARKAARGTRRSRAARCRSGWRTPAPASGRARAGGWPRRRLRRRAARQSWSLPGGGALPPRLSAMIGRLPSALPSDGVHFVARQRPDDHLRAFGRAPCRRGLGAGAGARRVVELDRGRGAASRRSRRRGSRRARSGRRRGEVAAHRQQHGQARRRPVAVAVRGGKSRGIGAGPLRTGASVLGRGRLGSTGATRTVEQAARASEQQARNRRDTTHGGFRGQCR